MNGMNPQPLEKDFWWYLTKASLVPAVVGLVGAIWFWYFS